MNKFLSKFKILIIFAIFAQQSQLQAVKKGSGKRPEIPKCVKSAFNSARSGISSALKSAGNGCSKAYKIAKDKCSDGKKWFDRQSRRGKGLVIGVPTVAVVILAILGLVVSRRRKPVVPPSGAPVQLHPAAAAQGNLGQAGPAEVPVGGQGAPVGILAQSSTASKEAFIDSHSAFVEQIKNLAMANSNHGSNVMARRAIVHDFGQQPTKAIRLGEFRQNCGALLNCIPVEWRSQPDDFVLKWI